MKRRYLFVLILTMVTVGAVFAQDDYELMPKNTITVDFGPTIVGAVFKMLEEPMDDEGKSSSGFGIGVQYERQIQEKMTLAGKFVYIGFGYENVDNDFYQKAALGITVNSFALEGHFRLYPTGDTFFLDGMVGYAGLSVIFSGEIIENINGKRTVSSTSVSTYRSYIKYGSKIGWRVDFGKLGGFIFEPSFGYYGGLSFGKTIGKQLADNFDGDIDTRDVDYMFGFLEEFILVAGPRFSLSFGWRF